MCFAINNYLLLILKIENIQQCVENLKLIDRNLNYTCIRLVAKEYTNKFI